MNKYSHGLRTIIIHYAFSKKRTLAMALMISGNQTGIMMAFSGHSINDEGIGILLNLNCSYTLRQHTHIVNGRLQALVLLINDKENTIINIYGPNDDGITVFNRLEDYMNDNQEKSIYYRRRLQHSAK